MCSKVFSECCSNVFAGKQEHTVGVCVYKEVQAANKIVRSVYKNIKMYKNISTSHP